MVDVLVIFGSASDEPVFSKIISELKEKNISVGLRIISAHRTPKELEMALAETDAKIFIAGAGLSAALPGVVASQVVKPVIGVPVSGNYGGLDALLSVHQMPPGIPVLGVGVDGGEAVSAVENYLKGFSELVVVKKAESDEIEKRYKACVDTLSEFGVGFKESAEGENPLVIEFQDINALTGSEASPAIIVPCGKPGAGESVKVLEASQKNLWVGLGRGDNAAIAAVELLNADGSLTERLLAQRAKMKEKVIASDTEMKGKYGE